MAQQHSPIIPIDQGGVPVSDLQRLVADGRQVTFIDGTSAQVVFSSRAMARVEDRYGSLNEYVKALNVGSGGPLFHLLAFTFSLTLGMPEDRALDLIDTRESSNYLQAISHALTEALPAQEEQRGSGNPQTASAAPSPGAISTSSPSSSGESTPSSSGV